MINVFFCRVERQLNVVNVFPVEKLYSVGGRFARAFTQQPGSDVERMAMLAYARTNRVYPIAENTSSEGSKRHCRLRHVTSGIWKL